MVVTDNGDTELQRGHANLGTWSVISVSRYINDYLITHNCTIRKANISSYNRQPLFWVHRRFIVRFPPVPSLLTTLFALGLVVVLPIVLREATASISRCPFMEERKLTGAKKAKKGTLALASSGKLDVPLLPSVVGHQTSSLRLLFVCYMPLPQHFFAHNKWQLPRSSNFYWLVHAEWYHFCHILSSTLLPSEEIWCVPRKASFVHAPIPGLTSTALYNHLYDCQTQFTLSLLSTDFEISQFPSAGYPWDLIDMVAQRPRQTLETSSRSLQGGGHPVCPRHSSSAE